MMNKAWMVAGFDWESCRIYGFYTSRQTAEQWVDYLNRNSDEGDFKWRAEEIKIRTKGPRNT